MDEDAIVVSTIPGSTYQRKDFLTACGAAWSQLNILLLPQQFANSLVFLTKLGLRLTLWQVLSTYDSFTVEVLISIATRRAVVSSGAYPLLPGGNGAQSLFCFSCEKRGQKR